VNDENEPQSGLGEEDFAETGTIDPTMGAMADDMHDRLHDTPMGRNIDAMLNVGLQVQIILGRSRMPIAQLLKLSRGSIIELDKKIGDPVEVMINDRLVAKGDLVKLQDDRLGVSLTEIVKDYVSDE